MAPKTEAALRKAIAHIRAGKASKAQPMLVELLRVEPNNAQAWYLLSYVLGDPQRQQYALLQALRVNPEFDKARKRLQKLRGEAIETETALQEPVPVDAQPEETVKPAPAFFEVSAKTEEEIRPQETASESEWTEEPPAAKPPRRTLLFALLVIIVAVLAYFAMTMYLPVVGVATQASATPIASQTLPATWTPSPQLTATASNTAVPSSTSTTAPTETLGTP